MNKDKIIYNIIYSILAIVIGMVVAFLDPAKLARLISILVGVLILLNAVPVLLSLFQKKVIDDEIAFINAIISIIIGVMLMVAPDTIKAILYVISGIIFVIIPVIKIIKNRHHFEEFKAQLVKLIIGSVLVIFGFGSVLQIVLYVSGGLIALAGVYYLIHNCLILSRMNKKRKKDEDDSSVIDV